MRIQRPCVLICARAWADVTKRAHGVQRAICLAHDDLVKARAGTIGSGTVLREEFSGRHGDWGRDAALWLGRRQGRLKLAELGQAPGGMTMRPWGRRSSALPGGWKKT